MVLDKHTWICSICGQGLTRKSTAKRHNNNLHSGAAFLVRPYEYIIGRLNGTFSQSDPSLYRRKKNASDSIYQQQPIKKSNDTNATVYTQSGVVPLQQPSHKPFDDVKVPDDTLEKKLDIMLKYPELKIFVNKYFSPGDASEVMIMANYLASQGNGVFLDKYLEALRNIDRAKS
jgi:hypothetical protein